MRVIVLLMLVFIAGCFQIPEIPTIPVESNDEDLSELEAIYHSWEIEPGMTNYEYFHQFERSEDNE